MNPLLASPQFAAHYFPQEQATKMNALFQEAMEALIHEAFGYEFIVRECLSKICLHLSLLYQDKNNASLSTEQKRLKEMLHYIHEHYGEKISLEEIASSTHISKRECLRTFKKAMQLSPFQYLLKYRMMQSADLLKERPDLSISEIATLCGFDSASLFSAHFRRFYNVTPRNYRKTRAPHK
jgi:transcriptional regulator GlxA family with amidase domain